MEDQPVYTRINALAQEEHAIWQKESRGETTDSERQRLKELEVMLDQCWDLLHQRKARRAAGLNPNDAKVRDAKIVEGYVE